MSKYAKALVAAAAFLAALGKALTDGSISSDEIGTLIPLALAVPAVWYVRNKPPAPKP